MKYRKRPIIIEAIRLPESGEPADEAFINALHTLLADTRWGSERDGGIYIETREGALCANPGDWIIRGIKGECYPIKDDIFRLTHEDVEEPVT